jgi:hypothetical protein
MGLGRILVVDEQFFQQPCFRMGAADQAACDGNRAIGETKPVGFAELTKAFRGVQAVLFFLAVGDHQGFFTVLLCICGLRCLKVTVYVKQKTLLVNP